MIRRALAFAVDLAQLVGPTVALLLALTATQGVHLLYHYL